MDLKSTATAQRSSESASAAAQLHDFADETWSWSSAREIPAWAISLAVHIVVLLVLGSLTQMTILDQNDSEITSIIEDLSEDEFRFEDAIVIDQVGTDGQGLELASAREAATVVGANPQERMQQQLDEEIIKVEAPPQAEIVKPNESDVAERVDILGEHGEHTNGVPGAVDRLTYEIDGSLKENKTLVVWLFDESGSMVERRNAIADRFESVYKQLGMLKSDKNEALKTAVVGFSETTNFYTPNPVDDVSEVVDMIRNIKPANSPKENVFTAVEQVTKRWLAFRTRQRRNFMIIIVTDERGDDYDKLEDVIHLAAKYGVRVYCVGNAAVFGREKGYITWTYDDGFKEDLPVDQGPETVAAERLQLPFWGVRSNDLDRMSAGIGPYALTRLCAETNGMYLIAAEGNGPTFDPAIMRNYLPDYRPIREYTRELQTNLAKGALVKAAMMTNDDTKRVPRPQLTFRADSDTTLRQELSEAQKPLARFDYHLDEMLSVLAAGEKDRPKLSDQRWRASYDLAMGRVLAMRVRSYGYNVMLAQMKSSPKTFETEGNNTWHLMAAPDISSGPQVKKMSQKATEYLTRIIDEHPGTPWAMLAERELSQPLGWDWRESRRTYSDNRMGPDGKRLLLDDDNPKMKNMPAPKPRVRPPL